MLKNPDGRHRGMGFLKVADQKSLDKIVAQTGCDFMGRYLEIEKAKGK
jgi:hypothetical protein